MEPRRGSKRPRRGSFMSWSAWVGKGRGGAGKQGLVGGLMLVRWGELARMNAAFGQVVLNSWRKRLKNCTHHGCLSAAIG